MPHKCYLCNVWDYNVPKERNIAFHRSPKDENLRRQWLESINKDQSHTKEFALCSIHFHNDDFQVQGGSRRLLKKGAIPIRLKHNSPLSSESTSTFESSFVSPAKKLTPVDDMNQFTSLLICTETMCETPPAKRYKLYSHDANKLDAYLSTQLFEKEDSLSTEETLTATASIGSDSSSGTSQTITASEVEVAPIIKPRVMKKRKSYVRDIRSDDFASPRNAKRAFQMAKSKVFMQQRRIINLQRNVRVLRNRIHNTEALFKHLKAKTFITENAEPSLQASLLSASGELFNRMLKRQPRQKYSPILRSFALTLNFYSPRAYAYVRKTFSKSLPHPSTLARWYESVDGEPGYTKEALTALELKVRDASTKNDIVACNLVLDEMSIRKQIDWTGKKFVGYVDVGTNVDSDSLPEARQVLVFMLVSLKERWKLPVAYFLIDSLSGREKAAMLNQCLQFVSQSGVKVTSITFDGASSNSSMVSILGAKLSDPEDLITFIHHPVTNEKVYIFYDAIHMIKLVRNCFAQFGNLDDSNNNQIQWHFVKQLVELQNSEVLNPGVKVRNIHLEWFREKMKVKLDTQTLSKSTADALIWLSGKPDYPGFKEAQATANFIQIFNDLFDIFNSRSKFAKYPFKRPITRENACEKFEILEDISKYIKGLKLGNNRILMSPRKTGFLGFLINIKSLEGLYQTYVVEKGFLKDILTYKLSQNHLELFLGAVCSHGGHNNNPSARQFETAYKKLLMSYEVSAANTGNVVNFEMVPILQYGSKSLTSNDDSENLEETKEYIDFYSNMLQMVNDHSYSNCSAWHLTDYLNDVVGYIAGFVTKCLNNIVTCRKCLFLLRETETYSHLQKIKEYKSLTKAPLFVISICKEGERSFRYFMKTKNLMQKSKSKNLTEISINSTYHNLPSSIFNIFGDHLYDDDPLDNHPSKLIKLILKHYFKIRLHYEAKKVVDKNIRNKVRSLMTHVVVNRN